MADFELSEMVERELAVSLVETSDFIDGLRRETFIEDVNRGVYSCTCLVAVRRPLDLETAELRRLEVDAERTDAGWRVTAVRGLERSEV